MYCEANSHVCPVPQEFRKKLLPVAERVFWWGQPDEWLDDRIRFVAQVMTYGDWNDVQTVWNLLGDSAFMETLKQPPAGVFDIKSWTYWHCRYGMEIPPMPQRRIVP